MSSIKKRDSGKWRARYRDDAGKEHAKRFERKIDAQRWLDSVTASIVRGDYVDPRAGRVTVRRYAKNWQAVQVSSERTRRIVDDAHRLHLLPALGATPIASVRPSTMQGFVRDLEAKGLAAGSVRNIYDVAARLFMAAVDDRVIQSTPCRKIRLPKGDDAEVEIPTVEEVAAVAAAIGDQWRAMVVTLAGSGLRIGELLGLEVADVDSLRRTIRVEKQRAQSGAVGAVKSKAFRWVVPVGQVVIDELAGHLAAYPRAGALFVDEFGAPLPYWRWKRPLAAATTPVEVDLTARTGSGILRLGVDRWGSVGEASSDAPRALVVGGDAADLYALGGARRRGPDLERRGRRSQSAYGVLAY